MVNLKLFLITILGFTTNIGGLSLRMKFEEVSIDDKVADTTVTEYVFGIPLHNIFYNKGQVPEYIISPVKYVL